jgi:hypothetical protein
MSYELSFSEIDDYLLVRIEGTWPRGQPKKIINDVADLSYRHPGLPLLIDIRSMETRELIGQDFFEVKLMAEAGFWRFGRIAVLDILTQQKSNDFFETIAFNRGLTVRFFYSDEQDAIDWLLSERKLQDD